MRILTDIYLYVDVDIVIKSILVDCKVRNENMKRINVMVSDEAKNILVQYKEKNNLTTLDETVDKFVIIHKLTEKSKV